MHQDIKERTFRFGLIILSLVGNLPENRFGRVLGNQVLRSGTSIGANVEEAHASFTRKDFIYTINIALKEARETYYWLRLIRESKILRPNVLDNTLIECEELKKILGAIVSKSLGKNKQ